MNHHPAEVQITAVRVIETDGTRSDIRFLSKRAARAAVRLMLDTCRNVRCAFVLDGRAAA